MGNRQGLDQVQADKYLRAGYTIIAIDYRLAPQAKLPQILEDLADAHPFYLYTRQQGRWPMELVGHDPEREPREFDRFCPLRNVIVGRLEIAHADSS